MVPGEKKILRPFHSLRASDQAHFFFDEEICNFTGEILTNSRKLVDLLSAADRVEVRAQIKETRL